MKFEWKNLGFNKYNRNTLGGMLIHFFIAAVILLFLCILYFYAYLPNITNHGETITVPNIEGLSIEKVETFLAKHDLRYEVNDSTYSAEYPPLTVLKQYPSAGAKVKENRKIYVSVNRVHPPTVPMPNLIDGSLINADAVLRGNELKRGRIQYVSGPFPNLVKEMRIRGKKLEPGTRVQKGSVVDLVVMDGGSDTVSTPNVVGFTLEDAKVPILGSSLNIGEIYLVGDTLGTHPVILKQKPEPGENKKIGDVVDLWIGAPGTPVEENNDENQEGDN
ncbi:MAG: PASTA domain-containing protein [Bacteroidota bacterium]